jgi:ATP-dependent Clp protease protease subunit
MATKPKTAQKVKKNFNEDIEENASPGICLLYSDVNIELAQGICEWILLENLSPNPPEILTLMVNSPGGDLSAAFSIIEMMNGSRIPIRTIALGEVCSAGLLIAMSGAPGQRIITPTCSVMSHHFSGGAQGNYHELLNIAKEYKFTDERIVGQYVRCTGLTEKQIRKKLIPNKDVYMSPKQAVELGLFDEIKGLGI